MPLRILTNTQSLFAQNNLGINQKAMKTALERLSSGLRINHSQDDAAGYLFAVNMTFQIEGTDAATNNLQMAVDLLNTADSYTQTITTNMERLGQLATQAHNGLLTNSQRANYDYEFQETINEIQRITQNAQYNGQTLLDGNIANGLMVQSGYSVTDTVSISIAALTTNALSVAGLTIATFTGASQAIQQINGAVINTLGPAIAKIGAQAAGWSKSIDAQNAYTTNLRAARSTVLDADIAAETTNLTNAQVVVQSGISALAQANTAQTLALGLLGR